MIKRFAHTLISLGTAVFAAVVLVAPSLTFPYLGIALFLGLLTLIAGLSQSQKTPHTYLLMGLGIFFASAIAWRVNPFLTLLNSVCAIYTLSALILAQRAQYSLKGMVFLPLQVFSAKAQYSQKDSLTYGLYKVLRSGKLLKITSSIITKSHEIIFALFLAVVISLLLTSVNPLFARLLNTFFEALNPLDFLERIHIESILEWATRFFAALFAYPITLKILALAKTTQPSSASKQVHYASLRIAQAVVALVLLVFITTQLQVVFTPVEQLLEQGFNLSELTREIFVQLSIVAGIVYMLLYNNRARGFSNTTLFCVLAIQTAVLTYFSFDSVHNYSANNGFTFYRLYGFLAVLALACLLISLSWSYYREHHFSTINKKAFYICLCICALPSIVNFDYLIYHIKPPLVHNIVDEVYLTRLSSDSQSFDEQIAAIKEVDLSQNLTMDQYGGAIDPLISMRVATINRKVNNLTRKYSDGNFQSFNFSEYLQFKQLPKLEINEIYDAHEKRVLELRNQNKEAQAQEEAEIEEIANEGAFLEMIVHANQGWQPLNFYVQPNETVVFSVSGSWSADYRLPEVFPDTNYKGYPQYDSVPIEYIFAPRMALLARVGTTIFQLIPGKEYSFEKGGFVSFAPNDFGAFGDNSGQLTVLVRNFE